MKSYILFIFGLFEDHEDIEYFCTEIFSQSRAVESVKYVIENSQNIIIIFESELDYTRLSNEIHSLLSNDNVNYYFLFEKEGLVSAHLPKSYNDFIFKYKEIKPTIFDTETLDLDDILDKIKKQGIDSLTKEEKKYLDNFDF